MTTEKFSIEAALEFGWRTMTGKFGTLMMYLFLPGCGIFMLNLVIQYAVSPDGKTINHPLIALFIPFVIIQAVVNMGMMKVAVKIVDGEEPDWSDYGISGGLLLNFIGASILFGLICGVGFVLLFVPLIIWYIQFHFYNFAIIDQRLGGITALKTSSKITKGARWKLFLFGLLCTVINLAGILCFLVGAIPAGMVTFLAAAHVYRQLLQKKVEEPGSGLVTPA